MTKTTCFLRRCRAPLAGAALLLLAAGCGTFQPDAGAGSGSPPPGATPTPDPSTTGPHPIYIINDGASATDLAGIKPGLIVNLQPSTSRSGLDEGSGGIDAYEVRSAKPGEPSTTGPHPIIEINLPAEPAPNTTSVRTRADSLPRAVVVIMGGTNTIAHGSDRRTIVVHIPLNIPYNPSAAPVDTPTPQPTASATHRRRAETR